ncbi:MAG TPA: pyridoxamine 5'-phosphate oxidase family protein [Candidatus Saccharimonadales bacterium]
MLKSATKKSSFSDRKQRFYDFLKENPVGVLSTVTPDCDPHGVVIYYTVDKNFEISFLTRVGTRKHDNIKHHNHVMLTVFEPRTQTTLQLKGIAHVVKDSYEVNGIAGAILAASLKTSDAGLPPITKLEEGPYVGYRITPKQARMAVFARPDSGEQAELFESIESFEMNEDV